MERTCMLGIVKAGADIVYRALMSPSWRSANDIPSWTASAGSVASPRSS